MASSQSVVKLVLDDTNCVEVNLHGATLTSWVAEGADMIFVSEKAVYDNKKAIRGGVPVIFPQFGAWELGPQHGFARISQWKVQQDPIKHDNGSVSAVFRLCDNEDTRKMWNHKFQVDYRIILWKNKLQFSLQVDNKGDQPFTFTTLLHTYFRLPDVSKTTISGLSNLEYIDKVANGERKTEQSGLLTVNCFTDRVYLKASLPHDITNVGGNQKTVHVTKDNFPDTVVWNPWADKAAGMSDFGNDEYHNMVCVEAGYVSESASLPVGQSFHASQVLEVL
ncbi:uncharacterized protein [Dysidea avara]|uniref:uncharacterized protein n=1 Tax=Dysidea avara TaxID=196820 RepID=UPI0033346A4C